MNLKKSEDSNLRRLQALSRQADEFKQKKHQIRIDLHNLESSATGTPVPVSNKKIIFSDDDANDEAQAEMITKARQGINLSASSSKRQKLIGSSDEDESDTENAQTIKMFEEKINMNEKKANQLLHLKTKYSNEDGRFKIDDRFVDGSSSSEASSSESESELEQSDAEETDKEKAPKKARKIISDESLKKKLKKETQASLDILASITGKSARKPVDPTTNEKKGDKPCLAKKMVRYDPTKTEHKIFELLSDNEEYESEMNKLKSEKKEVNKENEERPKEDLTKYTKIESNLKELFQSSDVFQFKFDNIAEAPPKNAEWDKPTKLLENKFAKNFNFNNSRDSSDEDSDDQEHFKHLTKNKVIKVEPTNAKPTNGELKRPNGSSHGPRRFLPLFEQDNQIKDALSYFCCVKDIDSLREEWKTTRDKMVEEYKKKHKRQLRIQKNKENEKTMTWRFKKKN